MLKGLRLKPLPVTSPVLRLTDEERNEGANRWSAGPAQRVVIHPGGVSARRWRPEHYRDLANVLAHQGHAVVLTGSESERNSFQAEALAGSTLHRGVNSLMGELSVRALMGVIASAHAVVSGATGPAHLAAALNIPTVSLFDPRRNNLPTRWKPLGRGVLLRPDVPTCEKGIGDACPFWDCLDRFTVKAVASRVAGVLQAAPLLSIHQI